VDSEKIFQEVIKRALVEYNEMKSVVWCGQNIDETYLAKKMPSKICTPMPDISKSKTSVQEKSIIISHL